MRAFLKSLSHTITHFFDSVIALPRQFDRQERRLVIQAVIIGFIVWVIVFALRKAVHELFHVNIHWLEHASTPFLLFVPLLIGALLVATIVKWRSATIHYRDDDGHIHELLDVEGDGLERAISLYFSSEPSFEQSLLGQEGVDVRWELPTLWLTVRKWLATLITLASGGSGGLEASVTLIGESTAAGLFRPRPITDQKFLAPFWNWWRSSNPDDLQTAQLCGIAAAVSTLLGAPFTAAFFAVEVMYRRRPVINKLMYALISALIAFFMTRLVDPDHTAIFSVDNLILPPRDLPYYGAILLMGVLIALVSIYFSRLRNTFDHAFHRITPNLWLRHLLGATITGSIAIIIFYGLPVLANMGWIAADYAHPLALVLGAGEAPIDAALSGDLVIGVALIALFAKMLATLATIGSGGSAGLLVPSIYFGTMVAVIIANLFGLPPMTLIIPAMTASLVAIVNVPLAAILLPVELFSTEYMAPAMVAMVVAYLFAHQSSIYRNQRETFAGREILPGYSARRYRVPAAWTGKSLIDLDIRQQFDVSIIGIIEQFDGAGQLQPHVHLNPDPNEPLTFDDTLVVIGTDEQLQAFGAAVQQEDHVANSAQ